MKRNMIYPIVVAIVVTFSSCVKSDRAMVKETGEKFIEALLAGDLATAKSLVTPATSAKWGSTVDFLDDVLTPEWKGELEKIQTRVGEVKVNSDEAQATIMLAIPSLGGEISVLHFRKTNGKWLIDEPGILVREVIKEETQVIDTI